MISSRVKTLKLWLVYEMIEGVGAVSVELVSFEDNFGIEGAGEI